MTLFRIKARYSRRISHTFGSFVRLVDGCAHFGSRPSALDHIKAEIGGPAFPPVMRFKIAHALETISFVVSSGGCEFFLLALVRAKFSNNKL